MNVSGSISPRFEIVPFQSIGTFEPPALPRDAALKRFWTRSRHLLRREDDQPFIADDRLQRLTIEVLNGQRSAPSCQPLLEELELTLGDWCSEAMPVRWLQLILLPPGDENDLLAQWAREQGHTLVSPPDSGAFEDVSFALDAEGVLVIPRLEQWFFRHRRGLVSVRRLLERLGELAQHCVIGCGSWAWAFLCKAADAHLFLPEPRTFRPFDEQRLHRWFVDIAAQEALEGYRFRQTRDGRDILAVDDQGHPVSDYFRRLAAYSRGIPWVAWHIWRRSLRSRIEAEQSENAREIQHDETSLEADEQTLWVIALEEFSLPGSGDSDALLILQALLIHESLDREGLVQVLPTAPSGMLQALEGAGFIERQDGRYRCSPAAYPAIRSGLATAGFPIDGL